MKKKSFLERLTGGIKVDEGDESEERDFLSDEPIKKTSISKKSDKEEEIERELVPEEEMDAELTIDLYQTGTDIIVQTMIAGVQPENLSITITRDSITVRGKREENQSISTDDYFVQELYWGSFSRTISLPEEINPEEAEAIEKHGLLIIKLPKIDKNRETRLKVKSI